MKTRKVWGNRLQLGDVLKVWWAPNKDTITAFHPYKGPYKAEWDEKNGGARIADFAHISVGMTIFGTDLYEVVIPDEEESLTAKKGGPPVERRSRSQAGCCSFCSSKHQKVWEVGGKRINVRFCDSCFDAIRRKINSHRRLF